MQLPFPVLIPVWTCKFPKGTVFLFWRTSFTISCSSGLLMMNSLVFFCVYETLCFIFILKIVSLVNNYR